MSEESEVDFEELLTRVNEYGTQAPESPIKILIRDLTRAVAYSQRGLTEAIERLDVAERELQDLTIDQQYLPVKVRLRNSGRLMVFASDPEKAEEFLGHLVARGYMPVEWDVPEEDEEDVI